MTVDQTHRKALRNVLTGLAAVCLLLAATPALGQLTDADVEKLPSGGQPIKFSHRIHVTDNKIDCQYCHIYARRSKTSGAPPVAICMGCHKQVATDLMEVKKLTEFWENDEPIPWVKIHDIPDFVRYTHEKHVNAENEVYPDGIPCQDCHGPIEEMDAVTKANPDFGLMGWCLECHLTIPGAKARKRALGEGAGGEAIAEYKHPSGDYRRPLTTDCLTCHY